MRRDPDLRARRQHEHAAQLGRRLLQSDAFFAMADELGLMIWQDFMFGGAMPPYDVAFREKCGRGARAGASACGDHPSIVLWCGNNEEETGWKNWGPGRLEGLDSALRARAHVRAMTTLFGQVLRRWSPRRGPGTPYWARSPSTTWTEWPTC
jgi:beta-mannosidase